MSAGQRNLVRDRHGKVVDGLQIQPATDKKGRPIERYFSFWNDGQKKRRKYHGNSHDKPLAILKYQKWKAQQTGETVAVRRTRTALKPSEIDGGIEEALRKRDFKFVVTEDGQVQVEELIAADAFWEAMRDQILLNPQLAAQKTGIEQLAYLDRLQPPPPSRSLEAIITLYLDDKKRQITPKEWKNSRTWWNEFCDITGARFVADLNRESFRRYRSAIRRKQSQHNLSPVWVRSRFGKIKTIINHAISGEMDISADDRSILELRSLLKQPSKPNPSPMDITRYELRAIIKQANDWQKALILVALNCAYYPVDCRRLKWSMVDLNKSTIRFDRTKATGRTKQAVPRVAVLWKRTINALKKIGSNRDYVFISTVGRPVHIDTIRRQWNTLCERAGIKRRLTFANLRDSALTVAAGSTSPVVPMQQYHVLAGHSAEGVDDNYIRRKPRFVERACRAIERFYFGG